MLANNNPSKRLTTVQFHLYIFRLLVAILIKVSFRLSAVNFFVLCRYTTIRNSTPVTLVACISIRSTSHNFTHGLTSHLVALLPVVHRSSSSVVSQKVALPSNAFRIIPVCPYVRAQYARHPEWADLFTTKPGEDP